MKDCAQVAWGAVALPSVSCVAMALASLGLVALLWAMKSSMPRCRGSSQQERRVH